MKRHDVIRRDGVLFVRTWLHARGRWFMVDVVRVP